MLLDIDGLSILIRVANIVKDLKASTVFIVIDHKNIFDISKKNKTIIINLQGDDSLINSNL